MKKIFNNMFRPVIINPLNSIITGIIIIFYIEISKYFPDLLGLNITLKNNLLTLSIFIILTGIGYILKNIFENIFEKEEKIIPPTIIGDTDTIIINLINIEELLIIAKTINKNSKIQKLILENKKDFELIIQKRKINDI